MLGEYEHAIFWVSALLQVLGLASVVGARLSERFPARFFAQRICYICLLAVGAATMLSVVSGSDLWFPFATTLALMFLGATVDFGWSQRASGV